MILIYEATSLFCVMMASILLLRSAAWAGEVVRLARAEGVHTAIAEVLLPRTFPQYIVRIGGVALCLISLALMLPSTVLEIAPNYAAPLSIIPFGIAGHLLLAALLAWRWLYYAAQTRLALLSMGFLVLISFSVELGQTWRLL